MRASVSNVLSLALVLLAWSWLLTSYLNEHLGWSQILAFIGALATIFGKEPVKEVLGWGRAESQHDKDLFDAFIQDLPVRPTIQLLKEHDFGDTFHEDEIQPLFDFCSVWEGVDYEFTNRKLEKRRESLYRSALELAREFARATVPVAGGPLRSVFPDNLRAQGGRPDHVIEDAKLLNRKANAFVPIYESFVRLCRRKLKS